MFEISASGINAHSIEAFGRVPGVVRVNAEPDESGSIYKLKFILEDESVIGGVISSLAAQNGSIVSLQKNEPTLEDVFLKLVGRSLTDEG